MRRLFALIFTLAVCFPTRFAHAHPEGYSGLTVTIGEDSVAASLTLHTRDFGNWFPSHRYTDYVNEVSRELERQAAELIAIEWNDQPLKIGAAKASSPETGMIQLDVSYPVQLRDAGTLAVQSRHLNLLPPGHQQMVRIEDSRRIATGIAQGRVLRDVTFSIEEDFISTKVPAWQKPAPAVVPAPSNRWWMFAAAAIAIIVIATVLVRWFPRSKETQCEASR